MKKNFFCSIVLLILFFNFFGQTPNISIVTPVKYQLADSLLPIKVSITSTYQLNSVTANVSGRQTALGYNQQTGYFEGTLTLSGLPEDTLNFLVTAIDLQSNQKVVSQKIIYDLAPNLVITQPLSHAVASPLIRIKASCEDNGGCTISAKTSQNSGTGTPPVLGTYGDSVDIIADMSAGEGGYYAIVLTATDKWGKQSVVGRNIYVESSPFLKEIFTDKETSNVGDDILDFNNDKVFVTNFSFLGNKQTTTDKIVNVYTHDSTIIPVTDVGYISKAFLHENGAIFSGAAVSYPYQSRVKEWNKGTLYDLNLVSDFMVSGNYAVYYGSSNIYLRNLQTQSDLSIQKGAYYSPNNGNVTSDGTVVFDQYVNNNYSVLLYKNNVSTIIGDNSGNKWNTFPATDGINLAYIKSDPCCPATARNFSLYLFDGQTNKELSNLKTREPARGVNYQLNNKYIAYSKLGTSGQLNIWLLDSAGNNSQITYAGSDTKIDLLGPTGALTYTMYKNALRPRRYFANANGQNREIASVMGKVFYRDTTWYLALGRTLFKIDLNNVIPNFLINSNIIVKKDSVYQFQKTDFTGNFKGSGNLISVRLDTKPKYGSLKLNGTTVNANAEITRADLGNMAFIPNSGYAGSDTLKWSGSNGIDYTLESASIRINVISTPSTPVVSGIKGSYCNALDVLVGKISNLPDTNSGYVIIKLDSLVLSLKKDSTFSYDIKALLPGNHAVTVTFNNGIGMSTTSFIISVTPSVTPDVNLSSSISNVTNFTDPVVITASSVSGGGATPRYTFAKDRYFINILQAEGTSNILTIQPNTLVIGSNWIYARMKTSDTCYTTKTDIDSVKIERSTVTGITDVDFPNQLINVFPNPFDQFIKITGLHTGKTYTVSINNASGQKVYSQKITNTQGASIGKAGLQSGRYWLSIYDDKKHQLIGVVALIKE